MLYFLNIAVLHDFTLLLGNSLVKVKVAIRQLFSKNLIPFVRLAVCRRKLQSYSVWAIHAVLFE